MPLNLNLLSSFKKIHLQHSALATVQVFSSNEIQPAMNDRIKSIKWPDQPNICLQLFLMHWKQFIIDTMAWCSMKIQCNWILNAKPKLKFFISTELCEKEKIDKDCFLAYFGC